MRAIGLLVLLTGCHCLPVPVTDATPPSAGLIIEYRPANGGPRKTVTVSNTDTDIAVDARKDDAITVIYSGSDREGVQRVALDYDMWYYAGSSRVSPLLAAINVTAGCPRDPFLGTHNFSASTSAWTYTFVSSATNWLGANTKSAKVTLRTQ